MLSDHPYTGVEPDSSRYVGEHNGASLWLAKGTTSPAETCLIAYADPDTWHVVCGVSPGLGARGTAGGFVVVPDDAPVPEIGT